MHPLESILYMAWRGFAIGVLISAPMGPVGMLCIQRTLDKGRKAGFYTGIGAAISDLIYCLITGFFLSLIEDFLQENQNVIQLIGSLVLIAFSIYLFRKSPSASLRRPMSQNVSAKKNILGGFLFTFSNPLIIFLIIGLFARFNFSAPEINGGYYAVGYVFLVAGALGWWYGVTYLIDKVRGKFNLRAMKRLNILIGLVILAFACVGIVSSIIGLVSAPARAAEIDRPPYYDEVECRELLDIATLEEATTDTDTDSITDFRLDFKLSAKQAKKSEGWQLRIADKCGKEIVLRIAVGENAHQPFSTSNVLMVTPVIDGMPGDSRPLADGISARGLNHFRVSYSTDEGIVLKAGNRKLSSVLEWPGMAGELGEISSVQLIGNRNDEINLLRPQLRLPVRPSARRSRYSTSEIDARIASTSDPLEGRWKVFDYSLEEKSIKTGGDYIVDILRTPEGRYEIVYHSGGVVNGNKWQRGYIKGELSATGHEGVYNVSWRDVEGMTIPSKATAQQESIDILTLHFPSHNSQLRLKRLP